MNRLTKMMQTTHKVLGTLLSILFLVWFLSGLVMIYHTFPKVSQADRLARMDLLSHRSLPDIATMEQHREIQEPIRQLSLSSYMGQTCFQVGGGSASQLIPADSSEQLPAIDEAYLRSVASRWNPAPVARIDTLNRLEQWIPFGSLKREFPIYKFHFADAEKHQLYLSSQSGNVLQYTDRKSRFWAWLGAIPHWIYFTSLRQDVKLWSDVVVWLSGIGCLMCVAGLYMGIRAWLIGRRRGQLSPYKKFWYKWHYLTGLLFGLPVLTFCFSGMMSLSRVQEWGIEAKLPFQPMQELQKLAPAPADYPLDYRQVIEAYPMQIRQMEWSHFGSIPLYKLYTDQGEQVIDARQAGKVVPLQLTADEVVNMLSEIHTDKPTEVKLIDRYDSYYIHAKRKLDLPVWKITFNDVDKSCYYVHPLTGQCRYVNRPARWNHWSYPALHSLHFRLLADHPLLWSLVMWCLMIGGTFVSLSGVWLTGGWLARLWSKRKARC